MKKITIKLSLLAAIGILLATIFIGSCKKSSTVSPPVLIGGYASSDSVAASSLIAYWPFDGNTNDVKGGLTGTPVRVTYTTGIRGQAYQGGDSVYATVTPGAAFNSLGSYSLSLWYKIAAQPDAGNPAGLFFLSGTANPNLLIYELEHYAPVAHDSILIHHGFFDVVSPAYQGFTMESFFDTAAIGRWVHVVSTYDGSSSTYTIYQNGTAVGNKTAFSNGGYVTPNILYTDGTKATLLGPLGFGTDTPVQVVIGTWPAGLYGVSPALGSNGNFMGQLDEVRVFKKALSSSEVAGLYLNGKAGR